MCKEVCGFVKRILSEAQRREAAASEKRVRERTARPVPPQHTEAPERDERSYAAVLFVAGVRSDHSPFLVDVDLVISKADDG